MKRLVSACIVIGAGLASCLVAAPHFSSTSQQVVVVSQDPVMFGAVAVGTTSPPQAITLSPPGTVPVTDQINSITPMCTDFAVQTPMGLPGPITRTCTGSGSGSGTAAFGGTTYGGCTDTTYTFTGTFSPVVAGTSSCAVLLDLASGSQTITFTGSGSAPTFLIDVQPSSINFGGVPTGTTSSAATMTVRNAGSAALTINSVALTANPNNTYALAPAVGMHTIPIGGQEDYTITCTPQATGTVGGMVTVTSNDSAHSPLDVGLSCTGITSDLLITPSPVTFSSARVGEPPLDVTVNIQYMGSGSRQLTGLNFDGTTIPDLSFAARPALPMTLFAGSGDAGGNSTTFTLHYAAATSRPMGPIGGVVVQATGLADQTVVVNGAALATSMSLTPAVVDLGPVCVGQMAHADVDVFANNAGSFILQTVTGVTSPFSLTNFPEGIVQGGGHATFTIDVQPTAPGALSQVATVHTDIPGNPTHDLMLEAEALPAGVSPTPDVVQFGTWMIGVASSLKKVQLTNCGTGPLTIQSASIDGTPEFQIVNDPPIMNAMVEPGMSFEIDLLMVPTSSGAKTAHLVLATDAGQQLVELDGAGTGGTDSGGKDRESYYACGTGRVVGLAPLALVLLVLRRRRR